MPETLAAGDRPAGGEEGCGVRAKEAIGTDKSQISSLALNAAGVVCGATESADTRCWGLLPDKLQVLRLELPVGEHSMTLHALGRTGRGIGAAAPTKVTVADGRNTYVLANFRTRTWSGRSSPAAGSDSTSGRVSDGKAMRPVKR